MAAHDLFVDILTAEPREQRFPIRDRRFAKRAKLVKPRVVVERGGEGLEQLLHGSLVERRKLFARRGHQHEHAERPVLRHERTGQDVGLDGLGEHGGQPALGLGIAPADHVAAP